MSPARDDPGTRPETKLARARMARRVTQEELAEAIGMSIASYRRLERGKVDNPGLRYLMNAAIALGVKLDSLIEDDWRRWWTRAGYQPTRPPDPRKFRTLATKFVTAKERRRLVRRAS